MERFHDFLEQSWLPGRTFASPADFNVQLAGWVATVNTRWRRHLECAPAAMTGLPPVVQVAVAGDVGIHAETGGAAAWLMGDVQIGHLPGGFAEQTGAPMDPEQPGRPRG